MRTILIAAALYAAALSAGATNAQAQQQCACQGNGSYSDGSYGSDGDCDACGRCRGCHHSRSRIDGLYPGFHCGCNGSYNYPVPPLYTYHWPGVVYKQVRMTDYHSPWRFPPIKPYLDESPLEPLGAVSAPSPYRPASFITTEPELAPGEVSSMSSRLLKANR